MEINQLTLAIQRQSFRIGTKWTIHAKSLFKKFPHTCRIRSEIDHWTWRSTQNVLYMNLLISWFKDLDHKIQLSWSEYQKGHFSLILFSREVKSAVGFSTFLILKMWPSTDLRQPKSVITVSLQSMLNAFATFSERFQTGIPSYMWEFLEKPDTAGGLVLK